MYAIVQVGGRQYRAAAGDRLVVDRLDVEPGSRVHLADVRMLVAEDGDAAETQIGRPRLEGVAVSARAVSHFRGPKILVFKYKPKKRYRRHQGFRPELTELRIEEVRQGPYQDDPAPSPAQKAASPEAATKVTKKPTRAASPDESGKGQGPASTRRPGRGAASRSESTKPKSAAAGPTAAAKGTGPQPKPRGAARQPAPPAGADAPKPKTARPRARVKSEPKDGS